MDALALNLLSGLVGALIGAFAGIYSVRHSQALQAEAALRSLLVAQRVAIRVMGSEEARKQLQRDFVKIYQAYQNLRSVVWWGRRRAIDRAWRNYKGNYEDVMPLFGEQAVESDTESTTVTSREFTREEIMEKIDEFQDRIG